MHVEAQYVSRETRAFIVLIPVPRDLGRVCLAKNRIKNRLVRQARRKSAEAARADEIVFGLADGAVQDREFHAKFAPELMREHHLGFYTRVIVVFPIQLAEDFESQVAGAVGRRHAANTQIIFHLVREF